ncbi:MAG TPA: hypothetical protein VLL08_01790, partial [Kineosporiaceae bacterium]|nr:hypothetical protein [Kineosporiaceae bacterium]
MSRVQSLLPIVPAARPEADSSVNTGRDFDDVLARTAFRQQPPASGDRGQARSTRSEKSDAVPRADRAERPERADHSGRTDRSGRAEPMERPEPADQLDRSDRLDQADSTDQSGLDRDGDTGADILADPVAGVIVDPVLLAAMVTTAPTVV